MTNNEPRANNHADTHADTAPSYLRRLTHTPLRDLLRLRATGRLDIDAALGSSGLPASTHAIIKSVVKKTRLWSLERVDVMWELVAHFQAALDADRDAVAAENAFGDVRRAAQLIRRAKRRARPLPVRLAIRGAKFAAIALGVYCVGAWGFYLWVRSATPTITRDYLAEINSRALSVAEEDRAWPLFKRAAIQLQRYDAPSIHPNDGKASHTESRANLASFADELDMIRRASRMPRLGLALGSDPHPQAGPDLSDMPIVYRSGVRWGSINATSALRHAISLLTQSAYFAALEGRNEEAVVDLIDALYVVRHGRDHPAPVANLSGSSSSALVAERLSDAIALTPDSFTDEQLEEIDSIAHDVASDMLDLRLEFTRAVFADYVQRAYTDDGQGGGRLTLQGLFDGMPASFRGGAPTMSDVLTSVRGALLPERRTLTDEFEHIYGMIVEWHNTPLWRRGECPVKFPKYESVIGVELTMEFSFTDSFFYDVQYTSPSGHLAATSVIALRVAAALERFRRAQGRWPRTLDVLVPDLLDEIPRDPFDGNPLRYRLVDGEPILYSIGMDRVDRGGVSVQSTTNIVRERRWQWWQPMEEFLAYVSANPPEHPDREIAKGVPKADWVLFSPELARRIDAQRRERANKDDEGSAASEE